MNKFKALLPLIVSLMLCGSLFAQKSSNGKSTIHVSLQNNSFTHVDLVNSYGNDRKTFASSDIVNDQFTLTVDLDDDIYRFDFGDNHYFLVVINKGETIDLTLDAEDLQRIVSVSGSESMDYVKESIQYSTRKRAFLDSLNNALQNDPKQKYWSGMSQNFNAYRQTNEDVDRYILAAFGNVDSLTALCDRVASNGKIKNSELESFVNSANKWLKEVDNNYRPFASYLENVNKFYDFSSSRIHRGYDDYYTILDQYIGDVNSRHELAERSLGQGIEAVKQLIVTRDSLVYNGLMDQKKNQSKWANQVLTFMQNSGSTMSREHLSYQQQVETNSGVAASLLNGSQEIVKNIVSGYQSQYNEMDSYLNAKIIDLIKEHKTDLAVLMFVDMFPREQNMALHEEVITALHESYPEHQIVKERWNLQNSPAGKTSVGAIAPDLAYADPDGNIRRLSDLRGQVVLLDFWASWCGPCRRENPNVRNVYAKYHDKGFDIYSVSLDRDAANWKRAIQDDKLVWPNHVSDLKYWSSEPASIYGVRSIPATFLLDKEGRIVAKDLRGESLENAVKQLLGL